MSFLSVLLLIGLVLLHSAETHEILASSNACGYSTTFTATIFSAPYNGQISGVRAVYNANTSVLMNLNPPCDPGRRKWGSTMCPNDRYFMVEIMKVTDASNYAGYTLYPTDNTAGYVGVTRSPCTRGCTKMTYFLTGQDIDDDVITWEGPSYPVTTNDQFMFQVGEGCCLQHTADNTGHVCASMYFLYDYINTSNPTAAPSGVTFPPSWPPTNAPSTSPTSSCSDYNNETSADGNDEIRQFDDKHITNIDNYFINDTFVSQFNSSHDDYQRKLIECVGSSCVIQCAKSASCLETQIQINIQNKTTLVLCHDDYSCSSASVKTQSGSMANISVICVGKYACINMDIQLANISSFNLYCLRYKSCLDVNI
eukprot:569776_1